MQLIMKFIKPSEISSKIMTLIEESDEYVIIVSPYIKISKWYKLLKKLNDLNERNITVEFIVRDDKTNHISFEELNGLGFKYKAIKDLHCKLYLNEKYAIVSSMNLLLSSEINSLELAYQTETESEFIELKEFCKRHLHIDFTQNLNSKTESTNDWRDDVYNKVSGRLDREIETKEVNGTFHVNTGTNNYSAFIWNTKQNLLRVSGILSGNEYDFLERNPQNIPEVKGLKIELQPGGGKHYATIWGTLETSLNSSDLNYVYDKEMSVIAEKVAEFILEIDGFKNWAIHNMR